MSAMSEYEANMIHIDIEEQSKFRLSDLNFKTDLNNLDIISDFTFTETKYEKVLLKEKFNPKPGKLF